MATVKNETVKKEEQQTQQSQNLEAIVLETRKVKALEKIANSLDALTIWFEEIDKKDWSERIAYYLYEFHNLAKVKAGMEDDLIQTTQSDSNPMPVRKVRPKKDIETV
jgi:hypothetical protein